MTCKKISLFENMYYTCQRCGLCCLTCDITLTLEEMNNICSLLTQNSPEEKHRLFENVKKNIYRIKKNKHGTCFFCNQENLCEIHHRFGIKNKPLACRVYPLNIMRWNDGVISADLRFDCPAVGVIDSQKRLCDYTKQIQNEMLNFKTNKLETCVYSNNNPAPLSAVRYVHQAFAKILHDKNLSLQLRLYAVARIIKFHEQKSMHQDIARADINFSIDAGNFIDKAAQSLMNELHNSKISRRHKLDLLAILCGYLRNDDRNIKVRWTDRIKKVCNNLAFGFGLGSMNLINHKLPNISGSEIFNNELYDKISPEAILCFEQYFFGKLDSMHFCGQHVHDYSYEQGLKHLLLSVPIIILTAAAIAKTANRDEINYKDLRNSLTIIEPAFSLSPFFKITLSRKLINLITMPQAYAAIINHFVKF
jgi:Fe-S-cluster containining protein